MAAKKYYAVKRGKTTGVFKTWDECRNAVEGYPGAQYKGFSTLEEAIGYLGESGSPREQNLRESGQKLGKSEQEPRESGQEPGTIGQNPRGSGQKPGTIGQNPQESGRESRKSRQARMELRQAEEIPAPGELLAYVDGSYNDSMKKYAFGCVFLLPDGRIYTEYGNGDNEQSLQHRNVTGEMLGAMYAVRFAMLNGFQSVEIRYDYQGIEKWVTGEWRSKTELTGKYAASMREWGKSISIRFTKVAAHTNVTYNELADKMAKTGLTMGNGVPKIRRLEDMEEYDGTDEIE